MKNVTVYFLLLVLLFTLPACQAAAAEGGELPTVPVTETTAVPATPALITETAVTTAPPPTPATTGSDENGSSPPLNEPFPATPIPSLPTDSSYVFALTGVNIRSGPGTDFIVLDWLAEGEVAEVTGTSLDYQWWQIPCGLTIDGRCWITAQPEYVEPVAVPDTTGAQRIQFALGASSATVQGSLAVHEVHSYVLQGHTGHKLLVKSTGIENHVLFSIQGVDDWRMYKYALSGPEPAEIVLPETQDYLIRVMDAGVPAAYALDVAIISTTVDPEPIRIVFNPGETSATFPGHASPFISTQYLVGVMASQTIHVNLSSESGVANFSLAGASDGQPYKRLVNSDTVWSGQLPTTQDYILSVAVPPDDAGTNYSLTVTVDPLPPVTDVPWIVHDGIDPPPAICVAFNPGDLPVPVRAQPSAGSQVVAQLGDWSEIVYSRLDWHEIRVNETETGWVQYDHTLIGGPCRSEAPVRQIVMIDSIGELPEHICAAHNPDLGGLPVAVRSQPDDDSPLLALLLTWTAVESFGDGWVEISYGFQESGWARLDEVSLAGACPS